jgi:hypothetical protein
MSSPRVFVASLARVRYKLGKPSDDYVGRAGVLLKAVDYAVRINIFVSEVIFGGGADADEEQSLSLDLNSLLDMMGGSEDGAPERAFIDKNAKEIHSILVDLQMDNHLQFMGDLVSGCWMGCGA